MHSRPVISKLIKAWRSLISYFAWPEPKPTIKRRPVKRSGLTIDALEDRTTPTILWGTPDFLTRALAFPMPEPIRPAEASQVRALETAGTEISISGAFSANQVAQVDRLLDGSPVSNGTWAPTPLPGRENVLPARDALFAQMTEEPASVSAHTAFPTMKHRSAAHPAMIAAMALVAVPLVIPVKSREEESSRGDGPRKPFPSTIRL